MKILAIETSCDETAVAVLETKETSKGVAFAILGNALLSQADLHAEFGGVYPTLAKREHQNNLVPLAVSALTDAGLFKKLAVERVIPELEHIRDMNFKQSVTDFLSKVERPDIDLIAVTKGPGLEPSLWTGLNFAESLATSWNIPATGIDHMEGHIISALLNRESTKEEKQMYILPAVPLPIMALLISGGHTEFMLMHDWCEYEKIGETKDDAVGEAFDKVARLLGLAYPGGPKIAELAKTSRERGENTIVFPRPMAHDSTCDLSFSGLKTAVMYKLKSMKEISESDKEHIAEAFENAARDVLVIKAERALKGSPAPSFVVAGGVSANTEIKNALQKLLTEKFPQTTLYAPDASLTGDNAIMIGTAAYIRHREERHDTDLIAAPSQRLA